MVSAATLTATSASISTPGGDPSRAGDDPVAARDRLELHVHVRLSASGWQAARTRPFVSRP